MRTARYLIPAIIFGYIGFQSFGFLEGIMWGLVIGFVFKTVEKTCDWCGRKYKSARGLAVGGQFCSKRCSSEYRRNKEKNW